MSALLGAFVRGLGRAPSDEELSALGEQLARLDQAAAEAWPRGWSGDDFIEQLGRRAAAHAPPGELGPWLGKVRADDLALAWACEAGREGAIDTFEEHFAPDLQRIVRRFSGPELPEEDLRQSLREHLFVGASERPGKIATYSGHGRLQNWLRVVATRRFTDALRAARPGREELPLGEALTDLPAGGDDHELTFMKREYRKQFGRAFSEALANLLPEERNLLRQHVVQRLTLEEMAKLRRTHASTISRRLDRVRSRLLEDTRLRLRATLQVGEGELDSILRLIRSNLDVSVSCLLELEDPPPRPT